MIFKEKILFISGFVFLIVYYIPFFYFGENSFIQIHDNLDSTIAYLNVLKDSDMIFSDGCRIFPAMEGLTRTNISFDFLPRMVLVRCLDPFTSYLLNEILGRLVGYIGMYLFLSEYFLRQSAYKKMIAFLVSLSFSLMSYYSDYGLSVMGLPLLIYSFSNLLVRKKVIISYLLISFITLYSSLVLLGLFVSFALFVYYLYLRSKDNDIHKEYIIGFLFLVSIYFLTNYQLFESFFMGVPSHRLEFYFSSSIIDVFREYLRMLKITQYHTGALPVVLILIYTFLLCFYERRIDKQIRILLNIILSILLFGFVYNCAKTLFPASSILNAFQFDRFYFLLPFFWMCLFAHILEKSIFSIKALRLSIVAFLLFFVGIFFLNYEYRGVIKKIFQLEANSPSYKQFYDTKLFEEIDRDLNIKKRDDKIVCLGFFPSVALYNGFYTLDGYFQSYPLSYKHKFRKVIASELEKSKELKEYFDNWGSRCYVFSSELGADYLWGKNRKGRVKDLDIDTKHLKDIGCTYIFSAVDIENSQSLNLEFVNSYTTPSSFWNIRVYKILS